MNSVVRYFDSLMLRELVKGLSVTFRYMLRPKYTVNYPEEKIPKSNRFRGLHALRDLPANADEGLALFEGRRFARARDDGLRGKRWREGGAGRARTSRPWTPTRGT